MMNKTLKPASSPLTLSLLTLAMAVLAHGIARAEATEEQLKRTKLYGDVSIAEDSVDTWGPWSHFEPPAAGPGQVVPTLPKRAGDIYRPLPQPEPAVLGCVAGGVCGFAGVYQLHQVGIAQGALSVYSALMTGEITQVDESIWPKAIRLTTTAFDPSVAVYKPDSGELLRAAFVEEGPNSRFVFYNGAAPEGGLNQVIIPRDQGTAPPLELVHAVNGVNMTVHEYVLGEEKGGLQKILGGDLQNAMMVLGRTTPAADMAALRADRATAVYLGHRLVDGVYDVRLDVQFGPGTWSGAWNGGGDRLVSIGKAADGQIVSMQGIGFLANGVIDGVNIRSTAVSTTDAAATVSGSVRGAFFGPHAAAVGGVTDIAKSNPNATVWNVSTKGYANGRDVKPFLAVNSKLSEKN